MEKMDPMVGAVVVIVTPSSPSSLNKANTLDTAYFMTILALS